MPEHVPLDVPQPCPRSQLRDNGIHMAGAQREDRGIRCVTVDYDALRGVDRGGLTLFWSCEQSGAAAHAWHTHSR
jgi:hypothetical protein